MQIFSDIQNPVLVCRDLILRRIAKRHGILIQDVVSDSRRDEVVAVRREYAQEAVRYGYTYTEIAETINRHRSSIYNLLREIL